MKNFQFFDSRRRRRRRNLRSHLKPWVSVEFVCNLAVEFFIITTGYWLRILFFLKEVYNNTTVCTVPCLFFLDFVLVFDVPSIDNQLRQLPDFKTVHVLKNEKSALHFARRDRIYYKSVKFVWCCDNKGVACWIEHKFSFI